MKGKEEKDRVEEIAAEIAALEPEEKRRLFDLLAAQGELPGRATALPSGQLELFPPASRPAGRADYLLVFDGGSRGNPGWGYGSYVIVRVPDGRRQLKRLELGDGYTNNEAEYDTLIAALHDLIQRIEKAGRRPDEFTVEIRGDSALVISQLQGKWKAKELRMRERRDRCLHLLQRFGGVELKTQPREASVQILGH